MKNILLTISYDGTDFCGWQRQDKADAGQPVRTVQGELETALAKLLKQPVAVSGSGRTDSGVHAAGQAANFFSPIGSYTFIFAPSSNKIGMLVSDGASLRSSVFGLKVSPSIAILSPSKLS